MTSFTQRTHYSAGIVGADIGSTITLNGWVATRRDLGGLIFIDLRDHTGIAQVVFSPQHAPALMETAAELRSEFVVSVTGRLVRREQPNPSLPTGSLEILAENLEVLNRSETPPFEIGKRETITEDVRLRYRYLDLRDPQLQRILRLRNELYHVVHTYFAEHGFVEIETPIMVRSTPEGARDYLVPSRIHPGRFYALPQSPQMYKQLLMVSGYDRYVQIARCFRDEDLRADRQPEFTQIDLEMAFVEREDVLRITEGFIARLWKQVKGIDIALPLPRLTYHEVMTRYGTDKPDTRFDLELKDLSDIFATTSFAVVGSALEKGGSVVGLRFPNGGTYSRKQIDDLTEVAKRYGAKGMVWLKHGPDGLEGSAAKFLSADELSLLPGRLGSAHGDLLLMVADTWRVAHTAMGQVRLEIARRENLIPQNVDAPLFVIDFPMFERDEETGAITFAHHPFTSYRNEDVRYWDDEPLRVRANAYDLVINGYEVASGSIRVHDKEMQRRIFERLGLSESEINEKFGFLLDAFRFGAPPHGGIAPGVDRLVMILAGTDNIRDVIAFPKTASAASLMDDAPARVSDEQLNLLSLALTRRE